MTSSTALCSSGSDTLGSIGELETVVVDDLAVGLAHGSFDDLGHRGLAVEAPEVLHRNLARPEPAELHLALEVIEPLVDARLQIGRRHDDAVLAFEACGGGLSHLHRTTLSARD